jgi:ATP-dependent protease ClpP protease subunit
MYKNTQIMIHSCSGKIQGSIQSLSNYVNEAQNIQNRIDKYYISKTKIVQERLDEIRKSNIDWYMCADEAIKLGIADEII